MKRQRNTTQMKEQTRNTEVQINEEEIGKRLHTDTETKHHTRANKFQGKT